MEENVAYIEESLGMCTVCQHNIYKDKTHPPWMACYCPKPTIEKIVAPPPPPTYDYED